jgi:hypothetical protein
MRHQLVLNRVGVEKVGAGFTSLHLTQHSCNSFDHICLPYFSAFHIPRNRSSEKFRFATQLSSEPLGSWILSLRYQDKVPDTWPLRGLPAIDVMLPKAALWISAFGAPKFTVLNTLKNSPLRRKLRRSVIGNFFSSETSKSRKPKVRSESKYLGAFPNVNGAGEANALILIYLSVLGWNDPRLWLGP